MNGSVKQTSKYFLTVLVVVFLLGGGGTMVFPQAVACDNCVKGSVDTSNKAVEQGLDGIKKGVGNLKDGIDAVSSSLDGLVTAYNTAEQLQTKTLADALAAIAVAIEADGKNRNELTTRLADYQVREIVKAIEGSLIAEANNKVALVYDEEAAYPISGVIGAARAEDLFAGLGGAQSAWEGIVESSSNWANMLRKNDETGELEPFRFTSDNVRVAGLASMPDETWNVAPLITKRQLSIEEGKSAKALMELITNPSPIEPSVYDDDGNLVNAGDAGYELKRKMANAKIGIVNAVLGKSIAERMEVMPIHEKWRKAEYVHSSPGNSWVDENGKERPGQVSVRSVLFDETMGKLTSVEWHNDIVAKTPAGLLREQVQQQAVNNIILMKMLEQEEQRLVLLALLANEEIEKSRPR